MAEKGKEDRGGLAAGRMELSLFAAFSPSFRPSLPRQCRFLSSQSFCRSRWNPWTRKLRPPDPRHLAPTQVRLGAA